MEEILSLARRVSESAEVFSLSSEEIPVRFEANRLKSVNRRDSVTVALRIIKNGRIGYAVSTSPEDVKSLVDNAQDTAQFGMEAKFDFPGLTGYPEVKVYDPAVLSVSLEHMVRLGEEMVSRVRQHTPELQCSATVTRSRVQVRIMNTRGGEAEYNLTIFDVGIEGTLVRGTDMLFVGDSESSCHPTHGVDSVVKTTLRQLELAKELASAPSKTLPAIFTPDGVASALIAPLMSAFNGKTVFEGASPLGGRKGDVVFDRKLFLADDATVSFRPGSRPCDDEAVPSQRTPLIEEGKVTGFFYDLKTAALAGTKSTGNGERGRGSLPSPSPSAFVITPGKTNFSDMVQDIKEGLLIENVMGAGQGNILAGDFSGNILLGYKIENGRLAGRVKDTMVYGNVYELLRDLEALGSDGKWIGSFLFTPSLYCPKLSVAAK